MMRAFKVLKILSSNVSVAIDNIYLNNEIVDTQKEVIFTLGEIVETRSKETANHVRRVAEYSWILARALGATSEEANILRLASPMHDIGKIGIRDDILLKPGKLSQEEFEIIKQHPVIGSEIVEQLGLWGREQKIIRHHHERYDGKGYPDGLKKEQIPLLSRILFVCDAYDAMASDRPYRSEMPKDQIIQIIKKGSGSQFDPDIVKVFLKLYDEGKLLVGREQIHA